MSRIGRQLVTIPEKVSVKVSDDNHLSVEGPKGKLEWALPAGITVTEDNGSIQVERTSDDRRVKALHGTARALLSNMVEGVSAGFVRDLEIQGVGFRASVKGKVLDLSLGYSHPVEHPIPDDLTVTVTDNTNIKVEGVDKQLVGQFASDVRAYYPPEPYKGKGVRYVGEYVRRKAGKSVQ